MRSLLGHIPLFSLCSLDTVEVLLGRLQAACSTGWNGPAAQHHTARSSRPSGFACSDDLWMSHELSAGDKMSGVPRQLSDQTTCACSADIVQWVTKKTGPPALLLNDASELRKAAASKPVYLLGYFSQLEVSVAQTSVDSQVAHSTRLGEVPATDKQS